MPTGHHFHVAGSPPQSPPTLAKRVKIFLPVPLVNIQPLAVLVDKLFDSLAHIPQVIVVPLLNRPGSPWASYG